MKVFIESQKEGTWGGTPPFVHEPPRHGRLILPHERRSLFHIEFEASDFGDEDTAIAATEDINRAPTEIRILAIQLMNIFKGGD